MKALCEVCPVLVVIKQQADLLKKQKALIAKLRQSAQTKIDFKLN